MSLTTSSYLSFHSGNRELEKGFDSLKLQALHWVFDTAPVGPYYEAALPGRDAFCMRDTSHQAIGAEVLGLSRYNFNMMKKFAEGIDEKRDYCSFWEIDRYDRPCPVDYTNDSDFWYNLPANFDLLDAILRLYLFTGNREYLDDMAFARFCALTMEQYIACWDRDGDGLPDHQLEDGRRGIASYNESAQSIHGDRIGCDLIGAMIRAYSSYAKICDLTGYHEHAAIYRKRGEALRRKFEKEWYQDGSGYASSFTMDGKYLFDPDVGMLDLLYEGIPQAQRAAALLDRVEQTYQQMEIEPFSHVPEVLWKYGRNDSAFQSLKRAMRSDLPRKEYPEASFCAIGAMATGLMGVEPDASLKRLATLSRLPAGQWASLEHICCLGGMVSITHADGESELSNESSTPILWRARFSQDSSPVMEGIDYTTGAEILPWSNTKAVYAEGIVAPGQTVTAHIRS